MTKELTVTEMCEQIKKMFAKLELQEEEYAEEYIEWYVKECIKAYLKTYGEYPPSYVKKLETKGE